MLQIKRALLILFLAVCWAPAYADDEASVETEALEIADALHCTVCSDPNIETAKDEIAKDLRLFIRKHLTDGKPQDLIINLVLSNYGEIVTLEAPPADRTDDNERLLFIVLNAVLYLSLFVYVFRRSRTNKTGEAKDGRS